MTNAFYEHPSSSRLQKGDGSLRERHSARVEDDRRLGDLGQDSSLEREDFSGRKSFAFGAFGDSISGPEARLWMGFVSNGRCALSLSGNQWAWLPGW